ncbi:MAG: diguanylate cyclase (GGDEF)-like protein [Sulfurimonas sp.]|jgi:diguanylate cyclase (GGDEF)-like protein
MRLFLFFLMLVTVLNANIIIDDSSTKIESFEMLYYNDTTGSLDINDISKLDFKQTILNKFALGSLNGNLWFKFSLVNNANNEDFLLNLNEAWFDNVNLYTFQNGNIIKNKNGYNILLKDKEIKDINPTFNLHIKKEESKTFYIKIDTHSGFVGKFILYLDEDTYSKNKIISIALYMFYLGAAFIVVILNLFLFSTLRERIYVYYSFYVLTFSVYMMVLSGMIEYVLQSSFYLLGFLSPLSTLLLILFSKEILGTSRYAPRLNKVLIVLSIIMLIFTLLVFLDKNSWFLLYTTLIPLVVVLILSTSIYTWRKGNDDAKYYIIFMLMHIIAFFILIMLSLGIVEYTNLTRYSVIISSFFEMSFFALVLANRFHKTKKEKNIIEAVLEDTKELANRDSLTNLYNRHYLELYSTHSFNEAMSKEQGLCVIMLDIDKFKTINDTYGHSVGDIVLINVANIFINLTRESDIVARYGGEEFIIILPNTSLQNAQTVAEKIRINIEKMKTTCEYDKELSVTISLGISLLRKEDTSMESIRNRADKALYESKNNGRNRVSVQ